MMVKNQKFFLIVDFDSSNYEFRYTELNATKETAALSNVQFLKNQEKLPFLKNQEKLPFLTTN